MRGQLYITVAAAAAMTLFAWLCWNAYFASLRTVAGRTWSPPEHVWSCVRLHVIAVEPGGAPLRFDLMDSMCGNRDEKERVLVGPAERADARTRLGLDPFEPESPEYESTGRTRTVAGAEWLRWGLVSRGR